MFTVADTYDVVVDVVARHTDVATGVKKLIDHCGTLCPSTVWREISKLDFPQDSHDLELWLRTLLLEEKPDESIVAFWFGIFDEFTPEGGLARLYLAGSESYDPLDQSPDWACSPTYFPAGRYADSRVLPAVSAILRQADERAMWLGSYVLPLGYAALAVAEACRRLPVDLLLGGRTFRDVAVGFDSGDLITLPRINRQPVISRAFETR